MLNSFESKDLRVRQSILYTVGLICKNDAQKQRHGHQARTKPVMSKEAMALIADLVYKQSEGCDTHICEKLIQLNFPPSIVMATDLQFFARHANRKLIKPEDVSLLARKQPNLASSLYKKLISLAGFI
ncbi:hypothetical protein CCR75_005698 [Bremia lactucae]|uniref:Centromere protein S n=1 Tax=Bremia lactucae TaxID=4779 RepID=A0A976FF49_BRELC|nr:hypothetical protein CCR75_005698 [Bremia lactucae]